MKHSNILPSHHMNQFACFDVPYLNEGRLKCENIRVVECEGLRCTLPLNLPVGSCPPAVAVHEEAEVGIVEKEFAVQTLDVNRFHVFFASNKVERSIGLVEESLPFSRLEGDDFEAFRTSNAKGGS